MDSGTCRNNVKNGSNATEAANIADSNAGTCHERDPFYGFKVNANCVANCRGGTTDKLPVSTNNFGFTCNGAAGVETCYCPAGNFIDSQLSKSIAVGND